MAAYVQASLGACSTVVPSTITRRSANYHPSVWGDHFLAYASSDLAKSGADTEKHQLLKEEMKKMVVAAADEPQQQLKLIDDIQRLGVAYHFEAEIDAALHNMNIDTFHQHDDDLHTVALCFRLLRQHGYNVSSEVFHKFKDSNGKFKEHLIRDARGVLSLYEATHLRVHGEDILEEALTFTTSHLELLKADLTNPLAAQVVRALKYPIRKGLNRLEARHYISIYQEDDSHNKVLLNFAKLDFNLAEAKWFQEDYVPTLEEYLRVALVSGGFKMLATHSFVGMGDLATKEAFDWVSNNPLILKAASVICRLTDDMVGHDIEQERGHVSSAVECYMKQHEVTKQECYAELQKQITNAWKDMNQECLRPTEVAMPLLARIYNLVCVINLLYDGEDWYTNSKTRTKDFITSVLVDPVPI